MKMKNLFQFIYTLIKLNILFTTFLFNSPIPAKILTEWNITSLEESTIKTNRYKSCQNTDFKQHLSDEFLSQKNDNNLEESFKNNLIDKISTKITTKQTDIQKIQTCLNFEDSHQSYFDCKAIRTEIKTSAKENWPLMRIFLSLSAPAIREHRLLADINTWLDPTPSHSIPDFPSISPLNNKELEEAKNIYLKWINQTVFDNKITLNELEQRLNNHSLFSPSFTLEEEDRIRFSILELRTILKEGYLSLLQSMPFLAYLEDEKDLEDSKSLSDAFFALETRLENLLQKVANPETNTGLLLSFHSIVEEVLNDSPEYCLTAEELSVRSERKESFQQKAFLGSAFLVAIPCVATGPIGISLCLLGEFGLGIVGHNWAKTALDNSLAQSFMGLEDMTMAGVEQRGRELKLEKFFLPLGVWLTSAEIFQKVVLWSRVSRNVVIEKAEDVLKRPLTREQEDVVWMAHIVGRGEVGKDSVRPAAIDNYTWRQIREKDYVLRDARFSRSERDVLIREGVLGDEPKLSHLKRPLANINDPQWIREELLDETRSFIKEEYQGQLGYLKFAKDYFGQEAHMANIFQKVSKAFRETSVKRPNWKQFPGKVFEYEELLQVVKREDFIERYSGQHTGYPLFSRKYTDGNMEKAYTRLSAVLDKNKFKELGWQQFQGSATTFEELPKKILYADGSIKEEYIGQQGYLQFALDHPEIFMRKILKQRSGNNDSNLIDRADNIMMHKTFVNISAALDKETFKKLRWQQFHGSVKDFKELIGKILNPDGTIKDKYIGQQGYRKFAAEHYSGEMLKTFLNVSAVLDDEIFKKLRWQAFQGSAKDLKELPNKILHTDGSIKTKYTGQQGYSKFATEHYKGDMQKTFINISAVLDDEIFKKLGWQGFNGNSEVFQELSKKILYADGSIKEKYIGQQGYSRFATEFYGGDMQKTFHNVSAVLDDEIFKKLGWQQFHSSVKDFKELPRKILYADGSIKEKYIGQQGYSKFATEYYGGEMLKTFHNVSAVLDDETFKKLGWQQFQGSSEAFQELPNKILYANDSIKDKYIGQQGQLKFAIEHYGGNMLKTFRNVSAALDKQTFQELGWQAFNGSSEAFQELPNKILYADGSIKNEYIGQQGYIKFATELYGGNMKKTFENVSAVLDDKIFKKLGWQAFNGSSEAFQELSNKILHADGTIKDKYIGQQGQLKFAAEHYDGNTHKTFVNISAILDKETFKELGWHHIKSH